jgi:dephospho-CoA kinase
MIVLGLTGSIGMGKTTAAKMFRQLGAPVFDSDQCVHELYEGPAVKCLDAVFPGVTHDGKVDRQALGALVLGDPDALARLEGVIHPLVQAHRAAFLQKMRLEGTRIAVLDVPLMFETGAEHDVDAIVVVTASAADQRRRVLSRHGMSEAKLAAILDRQILDEEKRRRAHFAIQTSNGFEAALRQIQTILAAVAICERTNPKRVDIQSWRVR